MKIHRPVRHQAIPTGGGAYAAGGTIAPDGQTVAASVGGNPNATTGNVGTYTANQQYQGGSPGQSNTYGGWGASPGSASTPSTDPQFNPSTGTFGYSSGGPVDSPEDPDTAGGAADAPGAPAVPDGSGDSSGGGYSNQQNQPAGQQGTLPDINGALGSVQDAYAQLKDQMLHGGGQQQAAGIPTAPAGPGGDQPTQNPFPVKNPSPPFGQASNGNTQVADAGRPIPPSPSGQPIKPFNPRDYLPGGSKASDSGAIPTEAAA